MSMSLVPDVIRRLFFMYPFMYPPILADTLSLSLGEGRGEVFYFIA